MFRHIYLAARIKSSPRPNTSFIGTSLQLFASSRHGVFALVRNRKSEIPEAAARNKTKAAAAG
jgi:hypothetical protein